MVVNVVGCFDWFDCCFIFLWNCLDIVIFFNGVSCVGVCRNSFG